MIMNLLINGYAKQYRLGDILQREAAATLPPPPTHTRTHTIDLTASLSCIVQSARMLCTKNSKVWGIHVSLPSCTLL